MGCAKTGGCECSRDWWCALLLPNKVIGEVTAQAGKPNKRCKNSVLCCFFEKVSLDIHMEEKGDI